MRIPHLQADDGPGALYQFIRGYTDLWGAGLVDIEALYTAIETFVRARLTMVSQIPVTLVFGASACGTDLDSYLRQSDEPLAAILQWVSNETRAVRLLVNRLRLEGVDHVITVTPGELTLDGVTVWPPA